MCTTIDAECVLANALTEEDRVAVTLSEISDIKNRLQEQLKDIYVDLSRDALIGVANNRPDLFCWSDNSVGRTSSPEKKLDAEYVQKYVNWRIPAGIRNQFIALCQI